MHIEAYLLLTEGRLFSYYTIWARTNSMEPTHSNSHASPEKGLSSWVLVEYFPHTVSLWPHNTPGKFFFFSFLFIYFYTYTALDCRQWILQGQRRFALCFTAKGWGWVAKITWQEKLHTHQRAQLPTQSPEFISLCAKSHHW